MLEKRAEAEMGRCVNVLMRLRDKIQKTCKKTPERAGAEIHSRLSDSLSGLEGHTDAKQEEDFPTEPPLEEILREVGDEMMGSILLRFTSEEVEETYLCSLA